MDHNNIINSCFVIAPIGEENSEIRRYSDKVLNEVIRPAISTKCEISRADRISEPGMIDYAIFDKLVNSHLVIADLTNHNPNVFYELAIRHCVGAPVIHLLKKGQRIPFDIRGFRTIFIDVDSEESIINSRQQLKKQIQSLAKKKNLVTPVSQFPEILSSWVFAGLESFCRKGAEHDLSESILDEPLLKFNEKFIRNLDIYKTTAKTVDLSNKELNRVDACLAKIDKLIISNSIVNLLDISEAHIEELDISYARINHLDASRSRITRLNREGARIIITDTWLAEIGKQIK